MLNIHIHDCRNTASYLMLWLGSLVSKTARNSALVGALLLSLSACISTSSIDVPTQEPAVIEDRAVVDGKALPLPDEPLLSAESVGEAERVSPVVARLMASAQRQRKAGEWDDASGSLERALRIEPRNASLWSSLAEVKYDQQDWRGAIQLAARSNTLSGNNSQLRRRNWYLMANAHQALGNEDAATKFREKLSLTDDTDRL